MRTGCRAVLAIALLVVSRPAFAQQTQQAQPLPPTRTALVEQQIKDKEQELQPYEPGRLESLAVLIESHAHLGGPSTSEHQGWYPRFGVLPLRGGLSFGAGYRAGLAPRVTADAAAATSFRRYRDFEGGLTFHRLGGDAVDVRAFVHMRDYPRERFFGLGSETQAVDRVSYRLRDTDFAAALTSHPRPWLAAGIDGGYLRVGLRSGQDPRFPSVEQRFASLIPAGLLHQPDYLHARAFAEASTLDTPGNPRAGGRYRVALGRYFARGPSGGFKQIDGEAMQLLPFFDKRRVIALRGIVSIARPDGGGATGEVPFYLMPSLGGARSLRGFDELRFRDRNLLLIGAEYRWEIFAGLDMALFVDAGKVTHAIGDLNLSRLHVAPGIGFRFNALHGIVATFDIAKSSEGRKYLLTFGPQW